MTRKNCVKETNLVTPRSVSSSSSSNKNSNKQKSLVVLPADNGAANNIVNPWMTFMVAHIAFRAALVNLSPITDCDEVYNYWEPLHFILYGEGGFQTWEYFKKYSLRTYMYLMPLKLCFHTLQFIVPSLMLDKRVAFGIMRSLLGSVTAICEVMFVKSINDVFGIFVATCTFLSLIVSPGMFHSSGALLPSATVMQYLMLSMSQSISCYNCSSKNNDNSSFDNNNKRKKEMFAILFGLMATLGVGWPFSAALFIPLGMRALYRSWTTMESTSDKLISLMKLVLRTLIHATIIQGISVIIDYQYYQSLTIANWNILKYNAMQGDDELYGTEPVSYYIKNLLLNFNIVAVLAFMSIPLIGCEYMIHKFNRGTRPSTTSSSSQDYETIIFEKLFCLLPMIIWLLLVVPRPHKEERFLFPIYPLVSLASSFSLDLLVRLTSFIVFPYAKPHVRNYMKYGLACLFFVVTVIPLGISRSMALHTYYSAPVQVYSLLYTSIEQLPQPLRKDHYKICVAGEWYRFPSSFMLPPRSQLEFLPSSFKGQLPQPFTSEGSAVDVPPQPFNDINKEEPSRYIEGGIVECDYLVDLLLEPIPTIRPNKSDGIQHILNHVDETFEWINIGSFPFLDAEQTATLRRTLYLPKFLMKGGPVVYANYTVFRQRKEEQELDTLPNLIERVRNQQEDETK